MKYVTAVVMGLLASGLVYIVSIPLPSPAPTLIALTFWIASSFLLQRGAQTVAQVLGRGFLLGAAEWLLMIVATIVVAIIAIIAGGLNGLFKAALVGGVSLFMVLLCLAGFAIVHFWKREMKPDQPERASPSM